MVELAGNAPASAERLSYRTTSLVCLFLSYRTVKQTKRSIEQDENLSSKAHTALC